MTGQKEKPSCNSAYLKQLRRVNMHQIVHQSGKIATMTSREMAELTEKRHDSVKRTIDTLAANGTISHPQIVDGPKSGNGVVETLYLVGQRDSYVIVAQLSPEFTARIVDRWQELESGAAPQLPPAAPKTSVISPAKEFRAIFGIARLIGLDKNAAAISANQGTAALTGVNMLQLMEQTHLPTPDQQMCFTPTEMGRRFCQSGIAFNRRLADAEMQESVGGTWVPTEKGRQHAVVLDTGKRHSSGAPVQQIKWKESVLSEVAA